MRFLSIITMIFTMAFTGCKTNTPDQSGTYGNRIRNLMNEMTLDEKIGQMQQVNGHYKIIPDNLRQSIRDGKIGSILNEVDVATVNEIQRIAIEESRLGIPILIARDVIHGFKTVFPIPLGQAATWNPELVEKGARIAALEASSAGVNWTFAPMIDISRDARWGRIAESFGEDPFLTSVLGAAMVKGFQGDQLNKPGSILACAKHFAGYGASEGGRDYNTTLIPENELRDIYLKPFKAAKDAGVASFMSGFNDLNGVPVTGNSFLLKTVLREEWGFEGFVVSDWASITEMIEHGYAHDEKDAALKAFSAGVDMEMATTSYQSHLKSLLEEGKIDIEQIDAAVYRILKMKFESGLFDSPYVADKNQNRFALPEYLEAAREAALQSIVMLKNQQNILPLSKKIKKVAVIGPMAHQKYEQLGTWIFDGDTTLSVTPLEGMERAFGKKNVLFAKGLNHSRAKSHSGFKEAVEAAKKSDAILLCLGEESILSGEAHSRAIIDLPGEQEALINTLAKTGKPIILCILAGRPLSIGSAVERANAVLYAFHFGSMGGEALADILTGRASPSGKLPVTFPKSSGQIPIYYNHKNTGRPVNPQQWMHMDSIPVKTTQTSLGNTSHYLDLGYKPLYPFGFGLTYTTFVYSQVQVSPAIVKNGTDFTAKATITNTGNATATEIVQLYIRDLVGDITRPVKELKGFQRVQLNPGESKEVNFIINTSDLSFHNQNMELVTEPGAFNLWIGSDSETENITSFRIE